MTAAVFSARKKMASISRWSQLPHELLGLVIDGLTFPDDRARFRAVCRSWHSAMRDHFSPQRKMPWIVLSDGSFLTPSDSSNLHRVPSLSDNGSFLTPSDNSGSRRLPSLPENARCIGSTNDWLALDCTDATKRHSYYLHNPFSNTTVSLPELETVIGNASQIFEVRKVLMRSTLHDVVALMTNNCNYPIILILPGKGVWLPKPREVPFVYIIDVVFLGDRLFGITQAEELVSLNIGFDGDDIPTVTSTDRIIRHTPMGDDGSDVWSNIDVTRVIINESLGEEGDDDDELALYELMESTGDGTILEAIHCVEDDNVPYEPKDLITTGWYFVESCGKLLMVRRQLQQPTYWINFINKVEIFEADLIAGTWRPMTGGLDGQALFISKYFCKSVSANGEIEKDAVYFVDTGEVLSMRSQAISMPQRELDSRLSMWILPPEVVV